VVFLHLQFFKDSLISFLPKFLEKESQKEMPYSIKDRVGEVLAMPTKNGCNEDNSIVVRVTKSEVSLIPVGKGEGTGVEKIFH